MKRIFLIAISALMCVSAFCAVPKTVTMSKEVLMDKIKGGWAAQTIGVTYGGPTEFRYRSKMIPDNVEIKWPEHYVKTTMTHNKHLYDDIYMDLTFVEVFEREGLDAPVESFATAFADAGYSLWHANQQARYNIKHGIMPPYSGHWINNPHADDIDFQIEADYAGLMSPGMTEAACHFCDDIGHIMNYGDGWYGGVYVAAMYSLAFIYNDIDKIVNEALKVIPEKSRYYRCMADVIAWHKQYPNDWKKTWQLIEDNHGVDVGCPEGVGQPYNIDAVINSAYILVGLLYGGGDLEKTMEISTRCGQDSDCNPASAAGILGTMNGYNWIPAKFLEPLKEAEDINFAYTDISLNKTYQMSYNQALKVIEKYGGKVGENKVKIAVSKPAPVRFEQCFDGMIPTRVAVKPENNEFSFEFDGRGLVLCGNLKRTKGKNVDNYTALVEIWIDGVLVQTAEMPAGYRIRQEQIWHNYTLTPGKHSVRVRCINPNDDAKFNPYAYIAYK